MEIKIFYDLEYGIFTFQLTNSNLSVTKMNKLERKIKKVIDIFLEEK